MTTATSLSPVSFISRLLRTSGSPGPLAKYRRRAWNHYCTLHLYLFRLSSPRYSRKTGEVFPSPLSLALLLLGLWVFHGLQLLLVWLLWG